MPQLKRREIVDEAHRKLGVLHGQAVDPEWESRAVRMLNTILAEENERMAGEQQPFYTQDFTDLALVANQNVYSVGKDAFLASTTEDFEGAWYRGEKGQGAKALRLVTAAQWGEIDDKDCVGDPEVVWHQRERLRSSAVVHVWPVPTITYGNCVVGSNGQKYICVQSHTSLQANKPSSGKSWVTYWSKATADHPLFHLATAWEESTEYTASPSIQLLYRRALNEADDAQDQVDMPPGWDRYVTYRLAFDLSAHFAISIEERQWLKAEYLEARELLFPSTVTGTNDHHNKTAFF